VAPAPGACPAPPLARAPLCLVPGSSRVLCALVCIDRASHRAPPRSGCSHHSRWARGRLRGRSSTPPCRESPRSCQERTLTRPIAVTWRRWRRTSRSRKSDGGARASSGGVVKPLCRCKLSAPALLTALLGRRAAAGDQRRYSSLRAAPPVGSLCLCCRPPLPEADTCYISQRECVCIVCIH